MEASALVFFAQVVDAGSFAAAARRMGLDRSNVSRRIHELERELACQLLRRNTRSMALTEAGAFFYERCRLVRNEVAFAQASMLDMTGTVSGRLTMSCPPLLGRETLAPVLAEFGQCHPRVDLILKLRNYVGGVVPPTVDLCVTITDTPGSDMVARPLAKVDWMICSSAGYLARQALPREPADLANLAWVDQLPRDALELAGPSGPIRVKLRTRLACTDLGLVRSALQQGAGIGVLPDYAAARGLADGSLVQVLPQYGILGSPGTTLYAIAQPARYLPAKVKALVEFMTQRLEARPPARA